MRSEHLKCEGASVILFVFVCSARVFKPNPVRNLNYKYQPSSFRISRSELWLFKRKATLELRERIYLLLDFLGYISIFSNLFLVAILCSRFSGINPLIGFEPSIFELSIFIRGKGKMSKNPYEIKVRGWFRIGKVLSTLNDFGTPKEPLI